jgi:FSR family fosmidomycin resistance protein-like MFS transporter
MALASTFGVLGGVLPLIIGVVADRFGLGAAMWLLLGGPLSLLIGLPRRERKPPTEADEGGPVAAST